MKMSQVTQFNNKTEKLQRQLGLVLQYLACFLHFAASYFYKYCKGSSDPKKYLFITINHLFIRFASHCTKCVFILKMFKGFISFLLLCFIFSNIH